MTAEKEATPKKTKPHLNEDRNTDPDHNPQETHGTDKEKPPHQPQAAPKKTKKEN